MLHSTDTRSNFISELKNRKRRRTLLCWAKETQPESKKEKQIHSWMKTTTTTTTMLTMMMVQQAYPTSASRHGRTGTQRHKSRRRVMIFAVYCTYHCVPRAIPTIVPWPFAGVEGTAACVFNDDDPRLTDNLVTGARLAFPRPLRPFTPKGQVDKFSTSSAHAIEYCILCPSGHRTALYLSAAAAHCPRQNAQQRATGMSTLSAWR